MVDETPLSDISETKQRKSLANLKPFKKGQSGNSKGRPKGASIKDMVRHHLENNPKEMEKFVLHFVNKNRELTWQMLEGKPRQSNEIAVDKEGLSGLTDYFRLVAKGGNE